MSENKYAIMEEVELNEKPFNFEELEQKLELELSSQLSDLEILEKDRDMIGNPSSLGESVMNVVWEQFINQVGVIAGEDFIKENRGLTLDLRDSAHIQTAENFANGKIAKHNYISKEQLEQNYDRYTNTPHKEFRKKYVDPGMDATLKRAGALKEEGINTVKDIYTGRQIPTETKLDNGKNNPKAAQREHVKPSAEVYQNASLQMANNDQELADIINDPENLQGYTTAERNNRKSDNSPEEMDERDKNKHWEKANERAEKHIKQKEQEGEERLLKEGKQTQKEEAFRIGGKALRAVLMGLLAELIKKIIQKLIAWFRSGKKNIKTFIESVKDAFYTFVKNLKQNLFTAGNTLLTTIATAIWGPVVNTIKKAWIFLKQGYKSLREAIDYVRNSKNKPFSILMLEVGKIIIAGLTAGGAMLLGETIEKGLMTIPIFAFEIPLLGSLASILGIFFGALVAGIIGAIALNLIDKVVAKKQKVLNAQQQIEKKNEILQKQGELISVVINNTENKRTDTANSIRERHNSTTEYFREIISEITSDSGENQKNIISQNDDKFRDIFNDLNAIKNN